MHSRQSLPYLLIALGLPSAIFAQAQGPDGPVQLLTGDQVLEATTPAASARFERAAVRFSAKQIAEGADLTYRMQSASLGGQVFAKSSQVDPIQNGSSA